MRLFDRKPHLARARPRAPNRAPHLPAEAPQRVQRKPDISSPGDGYEREADDVADRVMRMGEPAAIGSAPPRDYFEPRFGHGFEPVRVHAQVSEAGGREAPCGIEETLRSAGRPLDSATRSFFEPRFGRSFADVRVHSDATAAASAAAIDADAYTLGKHLVFGAGRFDPTSHDGRRLIAHELTHVTQQAGTGGRAMVQGRKGKKPSAADAPKLEVSKSKNGAPCACVVFVHNDERNARKTAKLMHEHCSYNLAMVGPDTGAREVKIPAGGMEDP